MAKPKIKALAEYLPFAIPLVLGFCFGMNAFIIGLVAWVIYYYGLDPFWPIIAWDVTWDDIETAVNNILHSEERQYLHLKLKSGKINIRVQREGRAEENKRFFIVIKAPRWRRLEEKIDTAYVEELCGQSARGRELSSRKKRYFVFKDDKCQNIIPAMKYLVDSLISLDKAVAKVSFLQPTAWIHIKNQSSMSIPITEINFWGKSDGRPVINMPKGDKKIIMEDGTVEDFEEFEEWRKGSLDEKDPA